MVPRPSFSCPCEKFCGRSADIVADNVCPPLPSWDQEPPQNPKNVTGTMKINFARTSQKRAQIPRSAPETRGTQGDLQRIWQTLKNPV